jgi:glycosyltransferase involved in cell wall biosynthesis
MRILLIARCPPFPLHFGDRLIVYHLARMLRQRGHTLDLLAFYDRDEDETDAARAAYADSFDHITLIREHPRSSAAYLRRLLPGTHFPRRADDAWSPTMWRAIESRLAGSDYDVVHLFGGVQVYEYAALLAALPTVITPYESYSLYLRRELAAGSTLPTGVRLSMQMLAARAYESFMFAPYGRVVVVSEADRAELLRHAPGLAVEVIPNGVDLTYFQPQAVERDPSAVLFVGNYEYAPNLDAALLLARTIMPAVRARIPDAKLWLVGNAPPDELRALASESVSVYGRVDDVRPYLAQAGVFACPLRFGAGIKNKVLEALAMECPVVATPLSIDGIGVQTGHDVLLSDVESFSHALGAALQHYASSAAIGRRGRALVEARYSWAQVAVAYERLFAAVRQRIASRIDRRD